MALFKIFKGSEDTLNKVQIHEGYAYFCEDSGNFFVDLKSERVKANAYKAEILKGEVEGQIIEIDVSQLYTKRQIEENFSTKDYRVTLEANKWVQDGDKYKYTLALSSIDCGRLGTVPPIITYESNREEYSYIEEADATPKQGIVFVANKQPTSDIAIVVIDNK